MDYALMFEVLEGGVSEPIKWGKENLSPDKNIIILDEGSSSLYLWHGARQGLVARRTALRQAESLKGHGYTIGKSIIGRDIKDLKEIDQRKIGRDPETDKLNEDLELILNSEFKELEHFIVTFELRAAEISTPKPEISPKPTPEPVVAPKPVATPTPAKTEPVEPKPIPVVTERSKPEMKFASEYDTKPEPVTHVKSEVKTTPSPTPSATEKPETDLSMDAKIGFVIVGIMDHYSDIWVSKKENGVFAWLDVAEI